MTVKQAFKNARRVLKMIPAGLFAEVSIGRHNDGTLVPKIVIIARTAEEARSVVHTIWYVHWSFQSPAAPLTTYYRGECIDQEVSIVVTGMTVPWAAAHGIAEPGCEIAA